MKTFPALMVGGPPHSGKSVLVYNLTQRLRARKIVHYAFRACPDGEGDFSNEGEQDLIRLIRQKRQFTETFVQRVHDALTRRIMPLMVDVGGKPTCEQEVIFSQCTHAILLASTPAGLAEWRAHAIKYNLVIVAELLSSLDGTDEIRQEQPTLMGTITGLKRGCAVDGALFALLCERVAALFADPNGELRAFHHQISPAKPVIDLEKPETMPAPAQPSHRWLPEQLPALVQALANPAALGVYGRGPGWILAAVATQFPAMDLHQFDAMLGWVTPLPIRLTSGEPSEILQWTVTRLPTYTWLEIKRKDEYYLSYEELDELVAPMVPADTGLIVSGRLPFWLLSGVVRAYQPDISWLASYYPPENIAVVVWSRVASKTVGQRLQEMPPHTPESIPPASKIR